MTEEERKHRQRMLDFSQAHMKTVDDGKPLTPEQLAAVLIDLKRKFPQDFPK